MEGSYDGVGGMFGKGEIAPSTCERERQDKIVRERETPRRLL